MRNRKEPISMEEIHKIREKLYYETEGMTIHEKLEIIGRKAASFKSKHNLKLKIRRINKDSPLNINK